MSNTLFSKTLLFVTLGLVLIVVGLFIVYTNQKSESAQTSGTSLVIGFSMSTLQEERWVRDREEFLKKAEELGIAVDLESSNNDAKKQISQIQGMILKGVDVLVIAPYDADSLGDVIDEAHRSGIKVISYDRLIRNADVDLYVSFDNEKVGEYEAKYVIDALKDKLSSGKKLKIAYVGGSTTDNNALLLKKGSFSVLQPMIDAGQISIVFDKFTPDWKPENAYTNVKAYLDSSNGAIDGIICANDGTAFGAIRALSERGLSGNIPVSGQDAELAALQRLVQGTQLVTVYKPIAKLAQTSVELAKSLSMGEKIQGTTSIHNGLKDIPSVLLHPIPVTRETIDSTVISDGYHTKEDIYKYK